MAKLETEDGKVAEIKDGDPIKEVAREFDVPFGCENGVCGTCQVQVLEGSENLNELNEQETDMGLDEGNRLCCQAKIKSGTVKIKVF
jgi:ferredoxin